MIRSVFGESVQGASHIRSGKECQDSLKKVEKDENTVILAVADGHGSDSCPYSKTGSYVAVNVCCGKAKKVTPLMYVLAVLFICKYIFL